MTAPAPSPARHPVPSARDLRFFGLMMLAALGWGAWQTHQRGLPLGLSAGLCGLGIVVCALSFAAPAVVRPIYQAWMALGNALGRVTTPVILSVLFVLVFIPTRVLLAVLRRDPLGLRPDRAATTYWSDRPRKTFARDDFERLS